MKWMFSNACLSFHSHARMVPPIHVFSSSSSFSFSFSLLNCLMKWNEVWVCKGSPTLPTQTPLMLLQYMYIQNTHYLLHKNAWCIVGVTTFIWDHFYLLSFVYLFNFFLFFSLLSTSLTQLYLLIFYTISSESCYI